MVTEKERKKQDQRIRDCGKEGRKRHNMQTEKATRK